MHGGDAMATGAIYQDEDRHAQHVSDMLAEHGLVSDEEAREMRHFLRGW